MFSVVIPLYDKAHTISDTLRSVLAQDCPAFEVIVVDDGSRDEGPAIVEAQFPDPRIRLVRQDNRGASAARNRGAEESRYDLIAFLDADDLWEPGYLTAIRRAGESYPDAGLYCCAGTVAYPDGSGYSRYSDRYRGVTQTIRFFQNPDFFSHTSSNVVRRSHLLRAGGFPLGMRHFEDQSLFWKVALRTEVAYCPLPLTVHRKGVSGQLSTDAADAYRHRVERTNITYACWANLEPGQRDPLFRDYLLYEFRSQIAAVLDNPAKVRHLFNGVDPRVRGALGPFERLLYPRPGMRTASRTWNRTRRAMWRARGYPVREYHGVLSRTVPRPFLVRA